jgi:hypothetical protein
MSRFISHLFVSAFICCSTAYSQYTTVTLQATSDSYVNSAASGTNYGTADTLAVKVNTTSNYYRSFLQFNLSGIPPTAVILSARLRLTPKGTENITALNSSQLVLDANNLSWSEGAVNFGNQPGLNSACITITASSISNLKREFLVTDHVQAMVDGRSANFGWRIRRNPENAVTANTSYYSRQAASSSNRPELIVQYYEPMSVSAASITHASSLSATDGGISPTIVNGSSTSKTYRWYNSSGTQIATTQNLSNVGYGWYGLKAYGQNSGDTLYYAFIVGAGCNEATITFNPGPKYTDDALCVLPAAGSGELNYGGSVSHSTLNSRGNVNQSLLRFRLWMDPQLELTQADLTQTNASGAAPTSGELVKVTGQWRENGVAYSNLPAASSAISVAYPSTTAVTVTKSMLGFWNSWKTSNTSNYGMLFRTPASSNAPAQTYHSSDATNSSNYPYMTFKVRLNTCDLSKRGTTTVTLDNASETASLSTTLDPPYWAMAPFYYYVSETPIPEMAETYDYLRDTIFGGTLDSIEFTGSSYPVTNTIGGLPLNKYFVAAFDKNWKRVYDKSIVVQGPLSTSFQSSSVTLSGEKFVSTSSGYGELQNYAYPGTVGKVIFIPQTVSGTHYYGFGDAASALSSGSRIKRGFKQENNKLYTMRDGAASPGFKFIKPGREIVVSLRKDTIDYTYDDTLIGSDPYPDSLQMKAGFVLGSATVLTIKAPVTKKIYQLRTLNTERDCSGTNGTFRFSLSRVGGGPLTTFNYTLADANTGNSYSGTNVSTSTFIQVPNIQPGVYTLMASFSNFSVTYELLVGYRADWDPQQLSLYATTPTDNSLERTSQFPAFFSAALSENRIAGFDKGWVWFDPVTVFGSNNKSYLTFSGGFSTTVPPVSEPYLSFSNIFTYTSPPFTITPKIVVKSHYPPGFPGYPGQVVNIAIGSRIIAKLPDSGPIQLYKNTITQPIISLTRPSGALSLKANSRGSYSGFDNVFTTFCALKQPLSMVSHYELKRDYAAGYTLAVENTLKFTFDEEYDQPNGQFLNYAIFRDDHTAVTGTLPAIAYRFDDNRYELNLATLGLQANKFYYLQVTTSTGEKRYLRFQYKY